MAIGSRRLSVLDMAAADHAELCSAVPLERMACISDGSLLIPVTPPCR
ncbi:hypothetical protein [Vulcanococcus limneticus]|nr:hypothetical protein [Vulcanococcus limneticus]